MMTAKILSTAPFCGIKIAAGAGEENVDAWLVGRCEQLLFAAIDEVGFEYRSERFDGAVKAAMNKKTDESENISKMMPINWQNLWR